MLLCKQIIRKKYLILVMLKKNTINHLSEKKIIKIKNNYLSTKTFKNPNIVDINVNTADKMNYYKTPKNFT